MKLSKYFIISAILIYIEYFGICIARIILGGDYKVGPAMSIILILSLFNMCIAIIKFLIDEFR